MVASTFLCDSSVMAVEILDRGRVWSCSWRALPFTSIGADVGAAGFLAAQAAPWRTTCSFTIVIGMFAAVTSGQELPFGGRGSEADTCNPRRVSIVRNARTGANICERSSRIRRGQHAATDQRPAQSAPMQQQVRRRQHQHGQNRCGNHAADHGRRDSTHNFGPGATAEHNGQ